MILPARAHPGAAKATLIEGYMITFGPVRVLSRGIWLCLLSLCTIAQPSFSQVSGNPKQLQQDGVARVDRWITHVRQTGDASGTVSDLAIAYNELKVSL